MSALTTTAGRAAGRLASPLFQVTPKDLPDLPPDSPSVARLEQVVYTVTECCQITLLTPTAERLVPKLEAYDDELLGFAYEGAGVGLAALDTLLPWKRRVRDFVHGAGAEYLWAVYLGAGMSLARLHRDPTRFCRRLEDPMLQWVVLDGYGFHEGFFAHRRAVGEQKVPARITGYAARAFDQGLGRSIWFSTGADVAQVAETIDAFAAHRRDDLWSGVGFACGYTGGVDRPTLQHLRAVAGGHLRPMSVGVAIAAGLRHRVGNQADVIESACEVLCGMSSADAAAMADATAKDLPSSGIAYEVWRRRLETEVQQWQ